MTVKYNLDNVDLDTLYIRKEKFTDAGLWACGYNGYGQLGTNNITDRSSPIQTVAGGTNWKSVSCGQDFTAAIKTDGTLWMYGYNGNGQLGNNSTTNRSSPVQIVTGGTNWRDVSCGYQHVIAIKTDGTLWTWGNNSTGQLGDNTNVAKSSPVQIVTGGTNWKIISSGFYHSSAIKTDGTLWLWGSNADGRLGDGTIVNKSSPVQTVAGGTDWKQVASGDNHTAAIKTDGTLWMWGDNYYGQLGDNTTVAKSSPVQTVAGGTNWKRVSCGSSYTAAIKTDGTLWLWGSNTFGPLGINNVQFRSSPVQTVAGGTNWKSVSCGAYTTAAIKTDGTLWTWGDNNKGQLGDNTRTNKSSPVQTVAGGTNWKQVASGSDHIAAIREI